MIVLGTPTDSEIADIFDVALTSELIRHSQAAVHIVAPTVQDHPTGAAHSVM
jgi:hypothetical protein